MAAEKQRKGAQTAQKDSGAVFLVKPVSKRFGLDYLHISLIVLVLVLIALSVSLSNFKPSVISHNCQYGVINNTCATPKYNSSDAISAAEKILASYSTINSSLSLLPYYSLVNRSRAYYLLNGSMWEVVVPYTDPFTNELINVSMLLYSSNLTLAEPFTQMIKPLQYTQNYVAAPGTIGIAGKTACSSSAPIPIYFVTDPYAPGALNGMAAGINASKDFGNKVNVSYKFVFSDYSIGFYKSYGVNETQAMGEYLACASAQPRFPAFLANLSKVYYGSPISNFTLDQVAIGSGLNISTFSACMDNVSTTLDYQAKFSQYYNITTSAPTFIVNCKYLSLPQTLNESIRYSLGSLNLSG